MQRVVDERFHIFGNTLVGIVGRVAEKLHAIMVRRIEPLLQIRLRHPSPPANLQPQVQIVLIDHEHGIDRGEDAKKQDGADEGVPVAILERIVKSIVPFV